MFIVSSDVVWCVKAGCGSGGGVTRHGRSVTMNAGEAECMEKTGK